MSQQQSDAGYYFVARGTVKVGNVTYEWQCLEASRLEDGEHILEYERTTVPVVIQGDEIEVLVNLAKGDLGEVSALPGCHLADLQIRGVENMVFGHVPDISPLHFMSSGEQPSMLVEWHDKPPRVFEIKLSS